jgi:hypothetical protein
MGIFSDGEILSDRLPEYQGSHQPDQISLPAPYLSRKGSDMQDQQRATRHRAPGPDGMLRPDPDDRHRNFFPEPDFISKLVDRYKAGPDVEAGPG